MSAIFGRTRRLLFLQEQVPSGCGWKHTLRMLLPILKKRPTNSSSSSDHPNKPRSSGSSPTPMRKPCCGLKADDVGLTSHLDVALCHPIVSTGALVASQSECVFHELLG
mmetsp:Transcript_30740/g.102381  ORF Transcript_30740/g.102381 Transcript_30740/m.102381 type:complete len:109 (+) Transcript_30740:442-768(+)